jgi:outer membrane protein assembly factor BamB
MDASQSSPWLFSAVVAVLGCSSNSPLAGDAGDAGHEGAALEAGSDARRHEAGKDAGPAPIGVLQHHGDGTRAGLYVDPAFTKAALPGIEPLPGFGAMISGSVFAQPLYLQKGVKGTDALFVVTEANDVYALDADTGAELWKTSIGTSVPATALPHYGGQLCGTIAPLGITGTPIIDLPSRSLLVSGMTMQKGVPDFLVVSIALDDGSVTWSVDLNSALPGFNSMAQMQRGALALQGDVVYVPFGGQAGGCIPFNGWVVGVSLAAPHTAKGWHTGASGGGIWGPSGAASDATSVYVATASPATWGISPDWSDNNIEAILRITPGPTFTGSRKDYFVPTDWFDYGLNGSQLGAAGVVLLDLPGSTPSELAFAIGKTSDAYLVDRTNLGGIGEGVTHFESATADWVEGAMAAYTTSEGGYVALTAPGSFCSSVADLSTIRIIPGSPPTMKGGWCAVQGGAGSPIASARATDKDVVVWGLGTSSYLGAGSGKLRAFDGDTGALIAESPARMSGLEHWISPIIANGRIYVAGDKYVYGFDLKGGPNKVTGVDADAGAGEGGPLASCLLASAPDQTDRCAPFGLSCQGNPQTSELGSCKKPTTAQPCLPAVGCASGLLCVHRGTANVCEATCTSTSGCTDLYDECSSLEGGTSSCTQAPCSGPYYSACSGGTCVPFYNPDGTSKGVCLAGGGDAGAGCAASRGSGTLCPVGSFCFAGASQSACLQLCDYGHATFGVDAGGPSCPAGQSCVFVGGDVAFGVCAETCGGDAGTICPSGVSCQVWNPITNLSACLP